MPDFSLANRPQVFALLLDLVSIGRAVKPENKLARQSAHTDLRIPPLPLRPETGNSLSLNRAESP